MDARAVSQYLAGGFAEDLAVRYGGPVNPTADLYPWSLGVGQTLFHSGAMSTKADGLLELQKEGKLLMNPADALRLEVMEGERVRIVSASGEATIPVAVLGRIPEGMLFFPESFRESVASTLSLAPDPVTGVPYTKQQRVAVKKIVGGTA